MLLLAGAAAGLIGSVAGLASLISYPALLAVGLGPVQANVTNTVSLVWSGVGSALGSRVELTGQGLRLRPLMGAAALGGLMGGGLLLLTPADAFEAVVPWLIALASVMVLAAPAPDELAERTAGRAGPLLVAGIFVIGTYGGYFGAAAGVMMLALLLVATRDTTVRAIAGKNVLLGVANGVAALSFVLLGPVDWAAVLPMALGFFVGGRAGPAVARRAPTRLLRVLVGVAGLGLAAFLAVATYA
ncbi:MAG: sulfite exporter TauE/SafE family protein [Actinomycetota bacterium]|nr:sulfite exporter TauE/SafE family protein [Actinomycetota bacterium]